MTQQKASPGAVDPCEAILKLAEYGFTDAVIEHLVGGRVCRTRKEVADAVGVSVSAIDNRWKPGGMPGEGKRGKDGEYPLLPIVKWKLGELGAGKKKSRFADATEAELKRQQLEEELRKTRETADRLERENQVASGDLVPRGEVLRAMRAIIASYSEMLMGVPDKLAPRLPVDQVNDIAEELRGDMEVMLRGFSERMARDVLKKA